MAVAGGIKSHAAMSGGKVSTSYYTLMLQYIGKLHDENDKPKPDENKVNEYQAVIVALAKDELKRIQSLIDGAEECKKGLRDFEVKSTLHSSEVQKNMTALSNQLTDENTDVDSLKVKMKDLQEKIDETNTNIDYSKSPLPKSWINKPNKTLWRLHKCADITKLTIRAFWQKINRSLLVQPTCGCKSESSNISSYCLKH